MRSKIFLTEKGTITVPFLVCAAVFCFLLLRPVQALAQQGGNNLPADSTVKDTTVKKLDTLQVPESPSALKDPIFYKAKDSIVYDIDHKMVYLYGEVSVKYQDIDLAAANINIDWNTNTLHAQTGKDSSGKTIGYPVFKQGEQQITTNEMWYNFVTKKARVSNLITKEGEGYIRGDVVKSVQKDNHQVSYVYNGSFTTCDYANNPTEEPHFYFKTKKLKLIQNDKVITGPAYLVVEGVPTPLVLPFGFFPANSRKTSGFIPPAVGATDTRGYVLRGGGFYFGFSKYFDLALTGDIYTGGSYRIGGLTHYAKRYKFNGMVDVSVARNQFGLPETKDYQISRDFNFHWAHAQDIKARPGTNFSAVVNFPSKKFLQNQSYNPNDILTQQVQSSISFSKVFTGTPFSLSASATHSYNLQQGRMDFGLPTANFSMARITPFKSKNGVGHRWYNDIGIRYNLNVINQLTTSDSTFTRDISFKNTRLGASHSVPISTSLKLFKWFTLSPNFSYNGYFYTRKTSYSDYNAADSVITTQTNGIFLAHEWNVNANLATRLYGTFKVKKGRILAIRHVMTPTLNAAYSPDFSKPYYGSYIDAEGKPVRYSYYAGGVISVPAPSKLGTLSFNLQNNLEMKVKTKGDSSGSTKKVSLLDYLNVGAGYNFLDTSFYKLSNIVFSGRTTLFNKLALNGSASLNPYHLDTAGNRTPHFAWTDQKKLGTFTSGDLSISTSLNRKGTAYSNYLVEHPLVGYFYPEPYADFSIPWDVGFSYNLIYSRYAKDPRYKFAQTVRLNGELALTPKWKISCSTGYDFQSKDFSLTQINIYRDLHCWEASLQWIPFGTRTSYLFNIRIKASTLRDLKLEKRKDFFDFQ